MLEKELKFNPPINPKMTMLFAVIFVDKAEHAHVRAANLQPHVAWLEANQDVILVGGSLRHEPEQTPKGGLWIAKAESKKQLESLLKTDPFYLAGLRQSYEILHWSKGDDKRRVLV